MPTRRCACCDTTENLEHHHLYLQSDGCPDDLMITICRRCHQRAHRMERRTDHHSTVREGLDRARARGITLGRPRKLTPSDLEVARIWLKRRQKTSRQIAAQLGVSKATLYRCLAEDRH